MTLQLHPEWSAEYSQRLPSYGAWISQFTGANFQSLRYDSHRKDCKRERASLATSERLCTCRGFGRFIERQIVDTVEPDVRNNGGLAELMKISAKPLSNPTLPRPLDV
ncbi:enolase C-terminal domain-like protein [Pseudomonas benzopyrenica]|uniref:enolase C-terminal domain-like protein n=1 Tax=Pseudomonas benzopyrenica TaxID=2993566 RepID=UPI0012F736CA